GAAVGLAAVSLPSYEGPLLPLTGGVDCSFLLSGVVGGLAYVALERGRTPEPEREPEPEPAESGPAVGVAP
ncbi:cytosine permease, partial [Streptomyces sp. NPDC054871]